MSPSPEKNKGLKLLKVDNWGIFFLQRLQLLFAKGDCCDLTLKFSNAKELKVHKLVLNTCTKYFESVKEVNKTIKMPETLSYTSMLPIINFMYSGKLEFKPELQDSLLTAARILNMTILVQLLIAQKPTDAKLKLIAKEDLKKLPVKTQLSEAHSQWNTPGSMLAEKKLPFWKKRVYPLMKTMPVKTEPEDPMPTRFELPSEETSSLLLTVPSFHEISYESEPVVPSPSEFTPSKVKFDGPIKRRVAPPPGVKAAKLHESQIISGNWSDEDDDTHFENIHTFEDSDDDQQVSEKVVTSTPKPILKPIVEQPPPEAPPSAKKVRFCLEKEDNSQTIPIPFEAPPKEEPPESMDIQAAPKSVPPQMISPQITKSVPPQVIIPQQFIKPENKVKIYDPKDPKPKDESLPNHAKIIAEVLKKYPDLVKNNKNIKLKITTPNALSIDGKPISGTGKSQYVVVKPNMVKMDSLPQSCSEAENTTGPWICKRCTTGSKNLIFESYYLFRKHLTDVHGEKIDPKICEICGYKASKKNLHLFHLYTKHGIEPPRNIRFPQCTLCKYAALNDSLLAKHYQTHQQNVSKELLCNICKLSFKSVSSFQAHCVTCKPNSEIRTYPCKTCNRIFRTNVSMKAHMKECQGNNTEQQMLNQKVEPVEMIGVPIMEQKPEHFQLAPGIIVADNNMALLHPDGNMSNVGQGVPNLGFTVLPEDHQTVILLDENSEFFLQGNNSVVVTGENNDEYVVPEILQDNMAQLYSSSNISYTVNGTSVITYPVVHMQPDGTLGHPSETISIPVSQSNDLFVSNKEITITEDLSEMKPLKEDKIEMNPGNNEPIQITPENEMVQQETVTPTTCIVRLDNDMMQNPVCLVDSNTPISIMDSDGTLTDTATIVNNQNINTIPDNSVSIINSDNILKSKSVINVAPDKTSLIPSEIPKVRVDQLSTEWDFDAEEEDSEIVDDPDSRPSRPTIELQEIV